MTATKKRTSASFERECRTPFSVLLRLTNADSGDADDRTKQKRQRVASDESSEDESPEDSPSPLLRKPLPQNQPSSLASENILNQMELLARPMKVLFDHMSKETKELKAEKEAYKKKYLEQEKIATSLSAQINDNHSLVTESSLVKELRTELTQRTLFARRERAQLGQLVEERETEIANFRQQLITEMETKQRTTREQVLELKKMFADNFSHLEETN